MSVILQVVGCISLILLAGASIIAAVNWVDSINEIKKALRGKLHTISYHFKPIEFGSYTTVLDKKFNSLEEYLRALDMKMNKIISEAEYEAKKNDKRKN